MAFEPKVRAPVGRELALVGSDRKFEDFSDGKQPTTTTISPSVVKGDNIPGLQPTWDRLQHVNQHIIASHKETQDIERTLWMYIQNIAKQCGTLEKKSHEYYNAWSASESSRAALFSDLQNLAGEKYALQQELEKGRKGNSDLSATLIQSNVALQEDIQELLRQHSALASQVQSLTDEKNALEQELKKALKRNDALSTALTESNAALQSMTQEHETRLFELKERLSRQQKKDASSGNTAATLSTSGSVSPLSLDPSGEVGGKFVKRPKRRVGAAFS